MNMNQQRSELMTISIFASSTRLSVKALRLYDQLDILKPEHTDPASGYRFYHVEQLHIARLIRMMRLMDMPLALIREILDSSPDDAEKLILNYWNELQKSLMLAGQLVQTLIHTLKGDEKIMSIEAKVKAVENQTIITIKRHVKVNKLDEAIQESLKQLHAIAEEKGVTAGTPFGIFHGSIDHENDGPIEICLPTNELLSDVGDDVQVRELASTKVVYVDLHGQECDFPNILKGYDAVFDWIRQNGYEPADSPYEVWHNMSKPEHMEIMLAFREATKK